MPFAALAARAGIKSLLSHPSWPAASRLISGCAARIQKRSCSRRNVCTPVRFDMSHTRTLLSSELEMIRSCTDTHKPLCPFCALYTRRAQSIALSASLCCQVWLPLMPAVLMCCCCYCTVFMSDLAGVEHDTADVVGVSTKCVNLPGLALCDMKAQRHTLLQAAQAAIVRRQAGAQRHTDTRWLGKCPCCCVSDVMHTYHCSATA